VSANANRQAGDDGEEISGVRVNDGAPPDSQAFSRRGYLQVGRYLVEDRIAAGGMAAVHIGRLRGAAGFVRTVAIKRLLPQFACDPEFETLFMHEARLVARIRHPNVVATLDVVAENGELILVMDYVPGETLSRLMQVVVSKSGGAPQPVVLTIVRDTLCGLHAAHEARDRHGEPLNIVHRDISPQNLLVGSDGVTRVLDFGIAKAATSVDFTRDGVVRGKAAYMAPEQLFGGEVCRRADIYAAGVVLWETLVGERLFPGGMRPDLVGDTQTPIPSPRAHGASIDEALEAIVMRALAREPSQRFATAQEMADQLGAFELASREQVASWVQSSVGEDLERRAVLITRVESADVSLPPPPSEQRPATEYLVTPGSGTMMLAAPYGPGARSAGARPSWLRMALLAGAFAGSAGVAAAFWSRSPPTPAPEVAAATVAPVAPPAASPPGVTPLQNKLPEPFGIKGDEPASENAAATPDAPASMRAAAPPAPGRSRRNAQRRARVSQRSGAKAAKEASCTPPYTVDAAGRRHYKPECF